MTIILVLIAVSLSVALIFLSLFIWSMRSGQYDDTYSPAVRVLFEDRKTSGTKHKTDHQPVADTKPDGNQATG